MKKNNWSAIVGIVTIIYAIAFVSCELVLLIFTVQKAISVAVFLIATLSWTMSLILLLGLNNAMKRIDTLEELLLSKKVIEEQEIEEVESGEAVENVEYCKKCGYQLFEEDKECPMCHTKREKNSGD